MSLEVRRAGPRQESGSIKIAEPSVNPGGDTAVLRTLLERIDLAEPMRRRAVQEAISQATAEWWRRRAEQFQWARPRPGDYNGAATSEELAAADERCLGIAQACLAKASLIELEMGGELDV